MTPARRKRHVEFCLAALLCVHACGSGERSTARHDAGGAEGVRQVYVELARLPLWPGFAPAGTPLAIFDGSSTWLFGHPSPPAEFDSIAPGVRRRAGRAAEVTANSSVQLGGVETATLKLSRPPTPDSTAGVAASAIHEAFHVFERSRHRDWAPNEVTLFTYPCENETLSTLVHLEMEALARAVGAQEIETAAGWARQAMAERRRRFARLNAEQAAYERNGELNEGLAQYIQHRALRMRRVPAVEPSRMSANDLGAPAILSRPRFAADGIRWRVYASGEAYAVLLDRFAAGWQDSIESGDERALDLQIEAALERVGRSARVGFDSTDTATALRAARASVAELHTKRAQACNAFEAAPGAGLRLTVVRGEPLWPQGFDPLNVHVLGNGAVLHTRWLRLGNSAGEVEVLDRSALTFGAGNHPLFEGVHTLEVTGLTAPLDITQSGDTLLARAPGLAAKFRGAQVARDGTWTKIQLGGGSR